MAATLKQIAEQAKVSPATVSLVLNMKPGVGAETRDKVMAAASDLDYRSRRRDRVPATRTVRFLRMAKHGNVINPNHRVFIADYIDGLERESRRHSCALEVSSYDQFDPEGIVQSLDQGSLAGAIIPEFVKSFTSTGSGLFTLAAQVTGAQPDHCSNGS